VSGAAAGAKKRRNIAIIYYLDKGEKGRGGEIRIRNSYGTKLRRDGYRRMRSSAKEKKKALRALLTQRRRGKKRKKEKRKGTLRVRAPFEKIRKDTDARVQKKKEKGGRPLDTRSSPGKKKKKKGKGEEGARQLATRRRIRRGSSGPVMETKGKD